MPVSLRPVFKLDFTMLVVGGSERVPYIATRPYIISDFDVVALATQGGASAELQRQSGVVGLFNTVSQATIAMTPVNTITRSNAIVATQMVVAATDVLACNFVAGGGAGSGRAFAEILPTPITGA